MKRLLSLIALLCFASQSHAAGNVTAAVSGGTLTVTGDSGKNFVQVSGEGDITVEGLLGTTVNGTGTTETFEGVTAININLGAGNDRLTVGVTIEGDLRVALGAGQDACTLKGVHCNRLFGTVGYFPPTASSIGRTPETFALTDVHCKGNIQLSARGRVQLNDVSGAILALQNASGITGVGLDNSDTTGAKIKAAMLMCTFGRGDDFCKLTDCEITGQFIAHMNLGNDTLERENVTAGSSMVMEVESDTSN